MKKFLTIIAVVSIAMASTLMAYDFSANYLTDDSYTNPIDDSGRPAGNVNISGVKYKKADKTTTMAACSANPCILYGVIVSSGYLPTDYITIYDSTTRVGSWGNELFDLFISTDNSYSGATSGTRIVEFPYGIQTSSGLTFVNSSVNFESILLFRNQHTR